MTKPFTIPVCGIVNDDLILPENGTDEGSITETHQAITHASINTHTKSKLLLTRLEVFETASIKKWTSLTCLHMSSYPFYTNLHMRIHRDIIAYNSV